MDIREKLVELLDEVDDCNAKFCDECEFHKDLKGCIRRQKEIIADVLLANGVMVQEWIPVTERFPEEDTRVLVWLAPKHYEYTNVDTDRRYRGRWVRWDSRVTHWMPLPQPPKGE